MKARKLTHPRDTAKVCIKHKEHAGLIKGNLEITLDEARQRQLQDIAAYNDEDAAEIAFHSLLIESSKTNG